LKYLNLIDGRDGSMLRETSVKSFSYLRRIMMAILILLPTLCQMCTLFEGALGNASDRIMVGVVIHNENKQNGNPICFSFRLKYQLSSEVMSTFE
jgi:lipoprotein signal peptidase